MAERKSKFDIADLILVSVVFVMVLVYLLTCNQNNAVPPSIDPVVNRDDSIAAVIKSRVDSAQRVSDSLAAVANRLIHDRDSLKTVADTRKRQADTYIKLYREAKAALDTAGMLASCDSVVQEYDATIRMWELEALLADSIISSQRENLAVKDSQIGNLQYLVDDRGKTIDTLAARYRGLENTLAKEKRKRKLTWVAAAAAFVAGVFIAK